MGNNNNQYQNDDGGVPAGGIASMEDATALKKTMRVI